MNAQCRLGAATLKRLRLSRGWSLAGTARAILAAADDLGQTVGTSVASVQRSVARWESAKPTLPGDRYQLLLAHLYGRDTTGEYSLGPGSDFTELMDALARLGAGSIQLDQLRALMVRLATDAGGGFVLLGPAIRPLITQAMTNPSSVSEVLLEGLDGTVATVDAQIGSVPFVRLRILLDPVVHACDRLIGTGAQREHCRLSSVAARAYTLAARLAFETRDDTAAHALYEAATRSAAHLPKWRRSVVHMSRALVSLYSSSGPAVASRLIEAAVRDARAGESGLTRARAHALQAEMAARAGLDRPTRTALSLAWYDTDRDHSGDPSASSFSADHLRGFEGVCQLFVGEPTAAHDYFEGAAAALRAPREQVQRTIVTTDQALARIRMNAPREAADLLHGCIDTADSTGSRVARLRLRIAREGLRPWHSESWVRDLDDHMISAM
ncbi:hypothetical protein [Streptomyces rimosus]|uniref:hypothetical protein n=1 Tax=Streptomyces rimosus TaxID=1927 RepID=UPI0004C896BE|nr:hypothetical protein [Streptomyces rimosus]